MSLLIRHIRENDLSEVHHLFEDILAELHSDNPTALENYRGQYTLARLRVLLHDRSTILLAAVVDEKIGGFGFGRIAGGVGFIHWMGVRSPQRGSGIGKAILEQFVSEFQARGCHKLELYTYQNRPKLKAFYERAGFTETARLDKHYYKLNVIYMTRFL